MGETWKGHQREKGDPSLNDMHDLHIINMKGDMTLQEKMALQMALAVHVYLVSKKQSMDAIDFIHPWKGQNINKTEVMKDWMDPKGGKSNSERLGEFIESLGTEGEERVDIAIADSREDMLEKMHIDFRPPLETQKPEGGATLH